MQIRKRRVILASFALLLILVAAVYQRLVGFPERRLPSLREGTVEIHVIDVDQADCTLIRTAEGYILIDAGEAETGADVVKYLRATGVETISYAVFTHPDSDHIGGAAAVFDAFSVERVILPSIQESDVPDTEIYRAFREALEQGRMNEISATAGQIYSMGDVKLTVLAPNSPDYDAINDYSVALRVDFGDTSFLFTGDAEAASEKEMLALCSPELLDCTFFHAGHHGASTSNTDSFLAAVSPEIVAVSCGENAFGHPSGEALVSFARIGADVYRTDEEGTMIFVSDGIGIIKK